jgi:hypothetical protein
MKYLLVAGFACDVYRQEPRARIFFNDKLIDEFNIKNYNNDSVILSYKQKYLIERHLLEPSSDKIHTEHRLNLLPPLRFYELEIDNSLHQAIVRIDINNDDSNYVNGFITKSTLLQFRILSLFPFDKKITEWFLQKFCEKRNSYRYPWYRRTRLNNFFNCETTYYNKLLWIGKNGKKIEGDNTPFMKMHNIGGSGSLFCKFFKKYGILVEEFLENKKSYLYNTSIKFTKFIYDKYEQHENQRNTD